MLANERDRGRGSSSETVFGRLADESAHFLAVRSDVFPDFFLGFESGLEGAKEGREGMGRTAASIFAGESVLGVSAARRDVTEMSFERRTRD